MRHWIFSGLLATLVWPVNPAIAAEGFKATATASRQIPADILMISFHLIERSLPDEESNLRAEELRIRTEIEGTGAKIASWSARITQTMSAFNTSVSNYINRTRQEPQPVDTRRDVTVRLTGVKAPELIAGVLGRSGVRQGVNFTWTSTQAEAVREELVGEAAVLAVAKARRLAEKVGGKVGQVLDVTSANDSRSTTYASQANASFPLIGPVISAQADQFVDDASGPAIIISVSVTTTLQALP
jgi:Protein of unknown function (DUF541)